MYRLSRPHQLTGALFVSGLMALLAFGAIDLADRRHDPDLSPAQWMHVLNRLSNRSAQLRHRELPIEPAPPPPVEQLRRTRLTWPPLAAEERRQQAEAYDVHRRKTIVELQPFRRASTMVVSAGGATHGTASLINLNPTINVWYLLSLQWSGADPPTDYHLTNAEPDSQDLVLDPEFPDGITIADTRATRRCDLWSAGADPSIVEAASVNAPYVSLCDGAVTLRLRTAGRKTSLERTTDFLRNHVWGGEALTALVRETVFEDAFLDTAPLVPRQGVVRSRADAPVAALASPARNGARLVPGELGITVEEAEEGSFAVGEWYAVRDTPGIFISVIRPDLVASEILDSDLPRVGVLDEVERQALAYLMAFDLDRFQLGFALGTDHPRVNWSDRVPAAVRDASVPGPDGIDTIAPLVSTGILGPTNGERVAATFTGGFKRTHGAFRYGELATTNHGSHYGFVENGVIFSKLQPGLATLLVHSNNEVEIATWSKRRDDQLEQVRFARQNGVPLVTFDPTSGIGVPGALVSQWGPGNWSGSQDGRFRSLRAGVCIQQRGTKSFLIYGYFSSATPAAMARVFQAYWCRDAMHLDMNALEHTYAAVYRVQGDTLVVEHLIRGMNALDQVVDEASLPRFLGYADNRDFFYLLWRETPPER